jgi:sarcosine oxidase subunit beta
MAKIKKLWQFKEPEKSYDVVIIGGGLHGLATAYNLARYHKVKRIAVLEKRHLGYGGSGRNTEVVRSNNRAAATLPFYKECLAMWDELSAELEWNLMVNKKGLVVPAHSEVELAGMRMRRDTQMRAGIKIDMLTPEEIKKMVPSIDISDKPALPIVGGYYHPEGGTLHHDAAVWGFAKGCNQYGVDLCVGVEVTGFNLENEKVTGVKTNRGDITANKVHVAVGGYSSDVTKMVGITLPVVTRPMQVIVTEPMKPFLDHYVAFERVMLYTQQTLKGDLIIGGHMDPWQSWNNAYTTFEEISHRAYKILQYFPDLANVRIMRTWSGICDMCVDSSPVMGGCDIDGLSLDVAWGYYGYKSVPGCGKYMAEYIVTGQMPEKIKPFAFERFYTRDLVPEVILPKNC